MRVLMYILVFLYAISPFDFIPDFLIGGGWIDDLVLLGLLGWYHFYYRKKKPFFYGGYQRFRQSTGDNGKRFREDTSYGRGKGIGREPRGKNPYEVLGIKQTASLEEIKSAYRRLANQYHPDKVTHLGEEFKQLAEVKFKEIQEAYQDLKARSSSR